VATLDSIVVSAELTLQDWRALQAAAAGRLSRSETPSRQWLRIAGFIAAFAAAFIMLTFFDAFAAAIDLMSLGVGAGIVVVAIVVNSRLALRRMAPAPNGTFLGSCTYELRGDGLAATRRGAHSFSSWSAVLDVTRADAHVFVWIDRLTAYVIPGRALPDGVTIEALVEWIGAARARAPAAAALAEPAVSGTATAPATPAARAGRPGFARLLDLASLVALRRHAVLMEPRQGLTAALATLLALVTWAAFDWWYSGPAPVLYIYGLPPVAWYLLGGLAVAWVLAQASVPRIALARAIAVSAVGAWLAIFYSYLGGWLVGSAWASVCLLAVAVLYTLTYFDRATRALTGQAQPRAALAAFAATVAFFWLTEALYVYPMMWSPGETAESEEGASYHEVEPLLFAQRERVDAALAAVPSNDPAATELYFVGFAGCATRCAASPRR